MQTTRSGAVDARAHARSQVGNLIAKRILRRYDTCECPFNLGGFRNNGSLARLWFSWLSPSTFLLLPANSSGMTQ